MPGRTTRQASLTKGHTTSPGSSRLPSCQRTNRASAGNFRPWLSGWFKRKDRVFKMPIQSTFAEIAVASIRCLSQLMFFLTTAAGFPAMTTFASSKARVTTDPVATTE